MLGADRLQVHFQTKSKSPGKSKKQVCSEIITVYPDTAEMGHSLVFFILYLNLEWWKTGFQGQKIFFPMQNLSSLLLDSCRYDLDSDREKEQLSAL